MKKQITKWLLLSFLCLAVAISMTACIEDHEHVYDISAFSYDDTHHYYACTCGHRVNVEAHTIEDGVCTACGFRAWEETLYENGYRFLVHFNARGDRTESYLYGTEGEVLMQYLYTYDEDGTLLGSSMDFTYGDGTFGHVEYDAYHRTVKHIWYDENRVQTSIAIYDNRYDADGSFLGCTMTRENADGSSEYMERDAHDRTTLQVEYAPDGSENKRVTYTYHSENGDTYPYSQVSINARGERTAYTLDAHGNLTVYEKRDADGNLLLGAERDNRYDEQGNFLGCTQTEVYDDGTRSVYELDAAENLVACVDYAADGSLIATYTWDNHYDEQGNYLGCTEEIVYADGSFSTGELDEHDNMVTKEEYDANGNITARYACENRYDERGNYLGCTERVDYADGTYTISELDKNDDVISSVHYDKDGNVIDPPAED